MPAFRWQRAQRRRTLWRQRTARTAKPCGPGRRCYGQALAEAALASTGAVPVNFARVREARTNSAPGRARHKPSDHRAGKAVCWASPVCCCAVFLRYIFAQRTAGAADTRPSLRPSGFMRVARPSKAQAKSVARMRRRVYLHSLAVIAREGGRSSTPRQLWPGRKVTAYWIPRFSRRMTVVVPCCRSGSQLYAATLTRCSLSGTRVRAASPEPSIPHP